ncbi:cysteine proteinase [Histomonas meleagridis]|uniref:cysteine proteinase n=1 Tax=Histomonas meleagridis TaxID=135588 RepID=UPI00355A06B3|nr:cysteine proteinase [Histomonas meleagridis]KAH0801099.1 cysteine proteinase [Histomonas meleagridis]
MKAPAPGLFQYDQIVHRNALKFDDDLCCSVTLSTKNIYVCLTCGKPFSGGSSTSPLTQHFVEKFHPLAIRMSDTEIVVLPNYDVLPDVPELQDIRFTAHPVYTQKTIAFMHEKMKNGGEIIPGALGLETLKPTHAQISVIRFISCIDPLRDYFLLKDFDVPILKEFSTFFKNFFNPYFYKKQISPSKLFRSLPEIDDPFNFLSVILNELNNKFGKNNLLSTLSRGLLNIEKYEDAGHWKSSKRKIWILPLEITDSPLYRSGLEKEKIIPQTELTELLIRYNGVTITETPIGDGKVERKKMKMCNAPSYLIISINRIKKNEFNLEKSNMHVILPREALNMSEYGINGEYKVRAIISHEGTPNDGQYLTYIRNKDAGNWIKCGTIDVNETIEDVAFLSQACFLLMEKI